MSKPRGWTRGRAGLVIDEDTSARTVGSAVRTLLPADHPLGDRSVLHLADLGGIPWAA
ncbi:hypothetical protein [Streptomyces sp. NPDC018045]|uniref:hypothetical protein n=1 Tax=Streptomyces sp. NPDC018045 TaxID=3365037 RepID=UPI00378D7A02